MRGQVSEKDSGEIEKSGEGEEVEDSERDERLRERREERGGKRVEKTEEDRVAACLCIQKDLKHFNKARLERPDLLAKRSLSAFQVDLSPILTNKTKCQD